MKSVYIILLLTTAIFACDPPRLSFQKAIEQFDLIFTGKAIAVQKQERDIGPYALTTFAVESLWKGPDKKRIVIETAQWGCSQTSFKVGTRLLIFAKKRQGVWYTTAHDQHNAKLLTHDPKETVELMALSDTYKGTTYFSSDTFSSAEVTYIIKGMLTRENLKEEHRWRTTLPKDSLELLRESRDAQLAKKLDYSNCGKTLFLVNDSLMTRKEFFYSVQGRSQFRLYEIPEDWVEKLKLATNHLLMATFSVNFYSYPEPPAELSIGEVLLLLEEKLQPLESEK